MHFWSASAWRLSWNSCRTRRTRCLNSLVVLSFKFAGNVFPKYLCVSASLVTFCAFSPTPMNMAPTVSSVVSTFVFHGFGCVRTAANSSCACSIMSCAYRTFVSSLPFPREIPAFPTRCYHLDIAMSHPALNDIGMVTPPCLTPCCIWNCCARAT